MKGIRPLPATVSNSMRSSIFMFDTTRVVEELVFNSLDAGATNISIFVGVVTCYLKIVDNGFGISRDDLVLLGERYATSKLHDFADMEAANTSFGFRGEALASVSDIALLEIATKAIGRPNGYRKVMKGSKCMYLGIDDDRKDAGTTVVVRDLFYNQPVRRRYMQSSPKKVLHSIKKCVLRIALVHSDVSFSITDIESDEELLRTNSSLSPLSLLMNGSGMEGLTSLHEVKAGDNIIRISGYISGPRDSFPTKAFQYVYINSRFISKGPIHKLLNQLACSFEYVDPWKADDGPQRAKRRRPQANPAYFLNLSCPRPLYDFTFEPSKTYVEFKDWKSILTFIEKAIQAIWRKEISLESPGREVDILEKDKMHEASDNITSTEEDLSDALESKRKRFRRQNHQTSHLQHSPTEELMTEVDKFSQGKHERIPFLEFDLETTDTKEQKAEGEFVQHTDNHLKSWDTLMVKNENFLWASDACTFLENSLASVSRSGKHDILDTYLAERSPKIEHNFRDESEGLYFENNFDSNLEVNSSIRKSFLHSCTSRGSLPHDVPMILHEEGFESLIDVCNTKRNGVLSNTNSNILGVYNGPMSFDLSPRPLREAEIFFPQQHSRSSRKGAIKAGFHTFSKDPAESFPSYVECSIEEEFVSPVENCDDHGRPCSSSEWCFYPFSEAMWDSENNTNNDLLEGGSGWQKRPNFRNFVDNEETNYGLSLDEMEQDLLDADYMKVGQNENRKEFCRKYHVPKGGARRSHSAPPFYREKKRFVSLTCRSETDLETPNSCNSHRISPSKHAANGLKHPQQSTAASCPHLEPNFFEDVVCHVSLDKKEALQNKLDSAMDMKPSVKCGRSLHPEPREDDQAKGDCYSGIRPCLLLDEFSTEIQPVPSNLSDFISEGNHDPTNSMTKWRRNCPRLTTNKESPEVQDQDCVLDITSGFLQQLAGESLVPESMTRKCLEEAKVLQQVDKKFIPVVAGGTLAVIDQHAADERIRLEELRRKVLAGEGRTVTYLDAEQEMILPEIGYQLLQNYANQIKDWGWICNIEMRGSNSFKKNMSMICGQRTPVTLHAVPCILGVNLSDADLLEFLQQLSDTDGSSTMPPSVLRVLNSKACRGAIMFGDSLLPSECSLIVEELKQTSLCFQVSKHFFKEFAMWRGMGRGFTGGFSSLKEFTMQCAHGRPTTVPLVDLKALHEQIAKLSSGDLWHGLHRTDISLERARTRLCAARD